MRAQQFDQRGAVARHAVEDFGGLAYAFDAGALRVERAQAAADQFVELDQQVAVDLVQARQVQQDQVAAFDGQGVKDLAGQRGRQKGQEHGLHLHVLVDDVFGQPFWRGPLQARHFWTDGVAINVVQHAICDIAAQRQVQRALQVAARGAVHAALLAVVVEEGLHGRFYGFDLDAAHARHHLRDFQQFFARQAAQHVGCLLLAYTQQHDGGLLHGIQAGAFVLGAVGGIIVVVEFGHFSASIV